MRVVLQGLAPGVENHGHADLGAEMPGISGDDGKCLGCRAEQDRVNGGFVLERDLAERCRQCEDDMKVRHRQMRVAPQSAHCSTWPPSTAVRHAVMAPMTRRSMRPRRPARACRKASPWRRKISATSRARAMAPAQPGGTTSKRSRSSGLGVLLIVLVATWV